MTSREERRGVLDTNVVLLLPQLANSVALPSRPLITAITLAELSAGPLAAATDAERARRQAQLQQAESDFDALPFDEVAARSFGRVAADLRSAGRKASARPYDALIAAIAIAHGLPLYTTNPEDFSAITSLEVIPVPHPDQEGRAVDA